MAARKPLVLVSGSMSELPVGDTVGGLPAATAPGQPVTLEQLTSRAPVNVIDFGAIGNGLGQTPAELGQDISSEPWNTWTGTIWQTDSAYSPYYVNPEGTFQPPRPKPYTNQDTWDYIGIMRALSLRRCVFIPPGKYLINFLTDRGGPALNGILLMKGQEQAITGGGAYQTTITTKNDAAFFNANNPGVKNYYSLFALYRLAGPPTQICDLALTGPESYGVAAGNLTLLNVVNVNGCTIRDCWFVAASRGVALSIYSSDNFIKGCTTEFLFNASVDIDNTCYETSIDFCNFWSSAVNIGTQHGVYSLSNTLITNTKFTEFGGHAVFTQGGLFGNNTVNLRNGNNCLRFAGGTTFTCNRVVGNADGAALKIGSNSNVVGNFFRVTGAYPCVDLGNGVTAQNILVSNNYFEKTNTTATNPDNKILIASIDGVTYYDAADSSCHITDNVLIGPEQPALGTSVFRALSGGIRSVTLDFGTTPVYTKQFTFTLPGATTAQNVLIQPSAKMPAGVALDELEMDQLHCAAFVSAANTITVIVTAVPGPIVGERNFNYQVS